MSSPIGKIRLRNFTMDDVKGMMEIANNKKISANLSDGFPSPFTEESARKFIKETLDSERISRFAIEYDGKHVGNIGLHPGTDIYSKNAELGYFVGEEYWGMGIATEAIQQMIQFGFKEMDLIRIYAGVFEYNKASMRVLEKCGLEMEGISRKGAVKLEKPLDVHEYAIVNPKYTK